MLLAAESFAILSSLSFGVANVAVKRGTMSGTSALGVYLGSLSTVTATFALLTAYLPPPQLTALGMLWFILNGVAGNMLARTLQYVAIERMGAASSSPITNITPIFSTTIAVLFLAESVTPEIVAGTLAAVLGLYVLSRKGSTRGRRMYGPFFLSLSAAFFYSLSLVFTKLGLREIPDPVFGIMVSSGTALLPNLALVTLPRWRSRFKILRRSLGFVVLTGVASAMGQLFIYLALISGTITVVGPLGSIAPLFVLVLAYIFLRQGELVDRRVLVGATLTVAGVVLVTI